MKYRIWPEIVTQKATVNLNTKTFANHWDWDSVPVEELGGGVSRQMIVGERLMVCRLRFAPHVVTPAHDHPHEQITLVERGRVRFILGTEDGGTKERIAQAGDVLHFPSGVWHGATMLDEEVVLIDIFTPLREDFLKPPDLNRGDL
jgi:quercetin dioxygenase-like cupin family protein